MIIAWELRTEEEALQAGRDTSTTAQDKLWPEKIIEVDPNTSEIVWEYQGDPSISFYSFHISGAERLANGNTLICEGAPGRIFEVTPEQEIVWEYINPMPGRTVARGMPNTPVSLFRAHRYEANHPGLRGKELDPDRYAGLNAQYSGE